MSPPRLEARVRHPRFRTAAGVVFLGLAATLWAGPAAFIATPESRVTISGRATIGSWECEGGEIIGGIEPGPELAELAQRIWAGGAAALLTPDSPLRLRGEGGEPAANISIPVNSLRCSRPGMRADVLRTLRAEEAPLIVFVLSEIRGVQLRRDGGGNRGRYHVLARGDLILAGVQRELEIAADVEQETDGRFRVSAATTLRMSDFGMTPPTALFGLIKSEDHVEVRFDLVFEAVDGLLTGARQEFAADDSPSRSQAGRTGGMGNHR